MFVTNQPSLIHYMCAAIPSTINPMNILLFRKASEKGHYPRVNGKFIWLGIPNSPASIEERFMHNNELEIIASESFYVRKKTRT